jgi:osmotically inducible protein OsmC
MIMHSGHAEWQGPFNKGKGTMKPGSSDCQSGYSTGSRFESDGGSSPEEMIGAAHAGCFSMALAHQLQQEGHEPESINTSAEVTLKQVDDGYSIDRVDLTTNARIPGIDRETFANLAHKAKEGCPVSKALSAVTINLNAVLDES